jgi:hypothetical protein
MTGTRFSFAKARGGELPVAGHITAVRVLRAVSVASAVGGCGS